MLDHSLSCRGAPHEIFMRVGAGEEKKERTGQWREGCRGGGAPLLKIVERRVSGMVAQY